MSEITKRPRAVTQNVRQQAGRWLTPVNLHWAGVAVLVAINLYLLIAMGVLWQKSKSDNAEALAAQKQTLHAAQLAAMPLEGLDGKLKLANEQADRFYAERLPSSYSEIATQLGVLKDRDHVRLTGVNYTQKPVADVSLGQLTEVTMDARLGGDYRGLVSFLNGLERDKVFFVVNGVTLTGQESGRVNLRVKLTTYLRGLSSDEEAERASTQVSDAEELSTQATRLQGGRR
jgi:hypothetical protein